jgi:tetraacyldisaccharide 4'-kinase
MEARAALYARSLIPSRSSRAFCVSVGNIAWGGSGKTPLASWLLRLAEAGGARPAVLTRGYGGRTETRPLPVKPWTSPEESGDEALMLAQAHPWAHILADPVRARALDWLEANTRVNFIILDDAMQHLALQRDVNLVLLREQDLEREWNRVIPWGSWREGAGALARADAFLLRMREEKASLMADEILLKLHAFQKPVFSFDLRPLGLRPLVPGGSLPARNEPGRHAPSPLPHLDGRAYALCAGVGNPASVRLSAETLLGRAPEAELIFPDHHKFSPRDLAKMRSLRLPLLITAKDAVKLKALPGLPEEIFVLESSLVFGPPLQAEKSFEEWFASSWKNSGKAAIRERFAPEAR